MSTVPPHRADLTGIPPIPLGYPGTSTPERTAAELDQLWGGSGEQLDDQEDTDQAASVFATALEVFARAKDLADSSPVTIQVSDGTEQGHTIHLQAGHLTYLAYLIRRDLEDCYGYSTAYPEEFPPTDPYEAADTPDDIGGFDGEGTLR